VVRLVSYGVVTFLRRCWTVVRLVSYGVVTFLRRCWTTTAPRIIVIITERDAL